MYFQGLFPNQAKTSNSLTGGAPTGNSLASLLLQQQGRGPSAGPQLPMAAGRPVGGAATPDLTPRPLGAASGVSTTPMGLGSGLGGIDPQKAKLLMQQLGIGGTGTAAAGGLPAGGQPVGGDMGLADTSGVAGDGNKNILDLLRQYFGGGSTY